MSINELVTLSLMFDEGRLKDCRCNSRQNTNYTFLHCMKLYFGIVYNFGNSFPTAPIDQKRNVPSRVHSHFSIYSQ